MTSGLQATGGPQSMVPYHINVGGVSYTTSLETLTKFPESRLAKMFSGLLPVTFDPMKQQYAIDRDGKMFRHILNFLRNNKLELPTDFTDHHLLLTEATYFEIKDLCNALQDVLKEIDIAQKENALRDVQKEFDLAQKKKQSCSECVVLVCNSCCVNVVHSYWSTDSHLSLKGNFSQVAKDLILYGYTLATSTSHIHGGITYVFTK